jgi:hypothetical protein
MASGLLARSHQQSPPVSLREVLRQERIKLSFVRGLDVEGRLQCQNQGFTIEINERLRAYPARLRFTVAHELGHTLFYDVTSSPPLKQIPSSFQSKAEESLCNDFARELLIPYSYLSAFQDRYMNAPEIQRIQLLEQICRECAVAREAVAFHLIRNVCWWDAILVFAGFMGKAGPGSKDGEAWRVLWSWHPPSLDGNLYIPGYSRNGARAYPKLRLKQVEDLVDSKGEEFQILRLAARAFRLGSLASFVQRQFAGEAQVCVAHIGGARAEARGTPSPDDPKAVQRQILLAIPVQKQPARRVEA